MDLEWLKILLEKLRMHSLIGACVFVSLCALLVSEDIWTLILVGSVSFLLIELSVFLWRFYDKYKVRIKGASEQLKLKEENIQKKKDGIWHLFIGLSEVNMKIAQDIFYAEEDPYNNHVRIIGNMNDLRNMIDDLGYNGVHPFYASIDEDNYIPCIQEKVTGDSLIIHFDPYFYSLLEYYIKNKAKKKL